jgi:uncharacterized protein YndB with AHSA1/START domain
MKEHRFRIHQRVRLNQLLNRGKVQPVPDIFHNFPIKSSRTEVFKAISTPEGLDSWWTLHCAGEPALGAQYNLGFGPGYHWRSVVTTFEPDSEFEFELTAADDDWKGTRLGFRLSENDGLTEVDFHHVGWPQGNEHYRISCFCWAMYLRLLKRYVEVGEVVAYKDRLDV